MLQTAVTASKPFSIIVMLMIIVRFCSPKQRKSKNCPLSSNPPHIKSPGLHSQPAPAWHQYGPLISMRKHSVCIGAHDWKNRSWLFARFGILSLNQTKLARICELVILCLLKRGNVCKRCFENLFFLSENRCLGGVLAGPTLSNSPALTVTCLRDGWNAKRFWSEYHIHLEVNYCVCLGINN